MTTAMDVSKWFVDEGIRDINPVTHLKLQKLLYFAQGYYLAYYDARLFNDPIEAWAYGPVVAKVYHQFKRFGNNTLTKELIDSWAEFDPIGGNSDHIDPTGKELLGKVWKAFARFTPIDLVKMTHLEGSPWTKYKSPEWGEFYNKEIPVGDIKDYFNRRLEIKSR